MVWHAGTADLSTIVNFLEIDRKILKKNFNVYRKVSLKKGYTPVIVFTHKIDNVRNILVFMIKRVEKVISITYLRPTVQD